MVKQVKSSRHTSRYQPVNAINKLSNKLQCQPIPIDINESILSNRTIGSHPTRIFYFHIIHQNSNVFNSCEFVIQISENPDICVKTY